MSKAAPPRLELGRPRELLEHLGLEHAALAPGDMLTKTVKQDYPAHRFLDELLTGGASRADVAASGGSCRRGRRWRTSTVASSHRSTGGRSRRSRRVPTSASMPRCLLQGRPGVGKTALAVGLAIKALEVGHRILFITCHDFVIRFRRAVRMDREDRLLATLLRPKLLLLDEIGYTPLEHPEATVLFEVVAKRYDRRKSIIVTSNKSWGA